MFGIDYIALYYAIGLLLFAVTLKTNKYFNPIIFGLFFYTVYQIFFRVSLVPLNVINALDKDAFFVLSLLLGFVLLLKTKIKTVTIEGWLTLLFIINIFLSLIAIPFSYGLLINCELHDCAFYSGLIPNKSMNSVLNCMLAPLFFKNEWRNWFKRFITLSLIFITIMSKSSTAFMCLVMLPLGYLFITDIKKFLKLAVPLFVVSLIAGYFFIENFFNPYGRFQVYEFFLSKLEGFDWLIGKGPGSFSSFGPFYQVKEKFLIKEQGIFIYAHSDIMQLLFEYGILGFLPVVYLVWNIYKRAEIAHVISVFVVLTACLFYYPLHFPFHLFIIFLILKMLSNTFERNSEIQG